MRKILFISVILVVGALLFIPVSRAQTNCFGTKVCNGLISTTDLYGDFDSSTGNYLISPRAAFVSQKIPTYTDLFTEYYTLSKAVKATSADPIANKGHLRFQIAPVIYLEHDLNIDGNLENEVNGPGVVFVGEDLTFSGDYQYGSLGASSNKASGTVFVVKGNVIIEPHVSKVDAVIISEGTIYTAGLGCGRSSVVTTQLEIKGSLVSLSQDKPIVFCRTLANSQNSNKAAEVITQQPKYLSIMRNAFASTLERWSEVN